MKTRIAIVGLLAIAAFVFGCGSGSSSDSTGSDGTATDSVESGASTDSTDSAGGTNSSDGADGSSESKERAAFVKQAEDICANVPVRYAALLRKLEAKKIKAGEPKATSAESNAVAAVPPLYEAAEEIDDLTPPSGEEQEVEAIVKTLEEGAEGLEAKPTEPLGGPKSPLGEFEQLTKEYGLSSCNRL